MKLYTLLLSGLVAILLSCPAAAQTAKKEIHNKEFNWTIVIPEGFESVTAEEWTRLENKGADAIEKTYGEKVENRAKTIFVFRSDRLHYLESNYQSYNVKEDGDYLESVKSVNDVLYGTFEAQLPNARLDSAFSTEVISGLTFQRFKIAITLPNKMILNVWMYSRLFGKKDFSLNIMAVDKEKERLLLEAWRSSKFGKQ
jgi:hypothetical protein